MHGIVICGVWGSRLRGFRCKNLAVGQHHTAPEPRTTPLSLSDCRVSGAWLPEPHTCALGLRPWLRARADGKGKIDGAGR